MVLGGLREPQRPKCCQRAAAIRVLFRNSIVGRYQQCGRAMKAFSTVLGSALLVAGCSQVIDQFYSKKNFDTRSFNADISECKERNPSFVAMHIGATESKDQVDEAIVRECMKAKGYIVQLETK